MRNQDKRRVHAATHVMEVVRYDRAGKWYLEPKNTSLPRQAVSVREAAKYAEWAVNHDGGWINAGLSGGAVFDRLTSGVY